VTPKVSSSAVIYSGYTILIMPYAGRELSSFAVKVNAVLMKGFLLCYETEI